MTLLQCHLAKWIWWPSLRCILVVCRSSRVLLSSRMVDDLHRLLGAAGIVGPFILVGSELGALNSRFYTHIHDV